MSFRAARRAVALVLLLLLCLLRALFSRLFLRLRGKDTLERRAENQNLKIAEMVGNQEAAIGRRACNFQPDAQSSNDHLRA